MSFLGLGVLDEGGWAAVAPWTMAPRLTEAAVQPLTARERTRQIKAERWVEAERTQQAREQRAAAESAYRARELEHARIRRAEEQAEAQRVRLQQLVEQLEGELDKIDQAIEHANALGEGWAEQHRRAAELVRARAEENLSVLDQARVGAQGAADVSFDPQDPMGSEWVLRRAVAAVRGHRHQAEDAVEGLRVLLAQPGRRYGLSGISGIDVNAALPLLAVGALLWVWR